MDLACKRSRLLKGRSPRKMPLKDGQVSKERFHRNMNEVACRMNHTKKADWQIIAQAVNYTDVCGLMTRCGEQGLRMQAFLERTVRNPGS